MFGKIFVWYDNTVFSTSTLEEVVDPLQDNFNVFQLNIIRDYTNLDETFVLSCLLTL